MKKRSFFSCKKGNVLLNLDALDGNSLVIFSATMLAVFLIVFSVALADLFGIYLRWMLVMKAFDVIIIGFITSYAVNALRYIIKELK